MESFYHLGSEYNSFRGAVTRIGDTYVFPYTTKITSSSTYQMAIATQSVFMEPPSVINNHEAVFDFVDHFDGTEIDPYKWVFANGDVSQTNVSNGIISLSGTQQYVKILGTASFGMDYMLETRAYHPDQGTVNMIAQTGFSDVLWNVVRIVDDYPSTTHWQRQAKIVDEPGELFEMQQLADTNWHIFRLFRNSPNIAGFQIDDNPQEITTGTINSTVPTMELPPYLMSYGEGNTFNIDWIRIRKWAGFDLSSTLGSEQFFDQGIDIGLYNSRCGFYDVNLRPTVDITNSYISNIQFTLRWPANTVEFLNIDSDFNIEQQGPVYTDDNFNYAIFVTTTPTLVNWDAGIVYPIMNFYHDQGGQGYGNIEIDTSDWSKSHNGTYYSEVLGFDRTGIIYANLATTWFGLCGKLSLKAILQGPYDISTETMIPALSSSGILPLNQPYNTEPWNYSGTENISVRPPTMIDWVLVELSDAPDPTLASPSNRFDRQAALLFDDGTITTTYSSPYLTFNSSQLDSLLVVIKHRNHLGIISANEVLPYIPDVYIYDFTIDASQAYNSGQKHLGNGIYGMIGGDANSDGINNLLDLIQIWVHQAGTEGYLNGDMNLDVQVDNSDKNDIWYWNFNKETQVPD